MATITEENRKHLRQALRVVCGFRETDAEPTGLTPANIVADFDGLANMDPTLPGAIIMDLAGDGFRNTGEAIPMETDSDSYAYGLISSEVAKTDGSFDNPPGFTLTADDEWPNITIALRGQYGETRQLYVEPFWTAGQTTIVIDSWTPGERVYITEMYLGMAWLWDSENLLNVNLDLRSVNTEIGGELEVSSIEIQAYEPTDYTNVIGRIQEGAPIWYAAGYGGDMSRKRTFYLSEAVSWDNNILRVCGQDATTKLDEYKPFEVEHFGSDTSVNLTINEWLTNEGLSGVQFDTAGSLPAYVDSYRLAPQIFVYGGADARTIIAQYTGVYRDESTYGITYVDAGRPMLMYGAVSPRWTIYADEITDFVSRAENKINRIEIDLPEYYTQWNDSIAEVQATANKTYFVAFDTPVETAYISPTPTSYEEINAEKFKFKAAATTTYTISGWEDLQNLETGNDPFIADGGDIGVTKKLDFNLPFLMGDAPDKSLTQDAIRALLNRSNIVYEFTYRGNPHIQPRDIINVEIATWEDQYITIDGLLPELDLYPSAGLYPSGEYKKVRKMVKTWETMTVDSITLEHTDGGGLTSRIVARKGMV
jgi:hypothetical protein